MNLHKILVATDFSAEADNALEHALDIARRVGAEIVLIHVCPVIELSDYPRSGHDWAEILRAQLAGNRDRLEMVRSQVSGQGVQVSQMVIDDEPEDGIIAAAGQLGADLIAMGTRGHAGIERVLLGSVAEQVIRASPVSVLVARQGQRPAGGYQRILVPTDFSASADRALEIACDLVARGGTIDLRHYWHTPVFGPIPDPDKLDEEWYRTTSERGAERLERHRSGDYEIKFTATGGLARKEILDQLDQEPYDLVVMGSHGRKGVKRLFLGSVAEAIIRHANCSVLVVKG
jgi:nucleotide-binding universal stress UspA family protein